jgi:CheY-like chemotaxis protein
MIPAATIRQARDALRQVKPRVIVLDIVLRGEDAWQWMAELKTGGATQAIPVLIATTVEDEGKGYALGADEYFVKPLEREVFLGSLARLTGLQSVYQITKSKADKLPPVLIIDDEAAARYILAKLMENEPVTVHQAGNGPEGLRLAREIAPVAIFLDLDMPEVSGFELLKQLKADSSLRDIPVAIVTSFILNDSERRELESQTSAIIGKSELSRARIEDLLASVLRESPEFNAQAVYR